MATDKQIHIVPMQQLDEAVDDQDNWTGLKDAKERRKRQNRLSQRATRRRKALEKASQSPGRITLSVVAHCEPSTVHYSTPPYMPPAQLDPFHKSDKLDRAYFPLPIDHQVLHIVSLNVCRAILTNVSIVALATTPSTSGCCSGLRTLAVPSQDFTDGCERTVTFPSSLTPTKLQQQIPHFGWIDMLPSPQLRDNLIVAFTSDSLSEDAITVDILGNIFDDAECGLDKPIDTETQVEQLTQGATSSGQAWDAELGFISWSNPWEVEGWEVTEYFARKWAYLLQGCVDVMSATNRWRQLRGESPLVF